MTAIIDTVQQAAQRVFDDLGPGWSEHVYEKALQFELSRQGVELIPQRPVLIHYDSHALSVCIPDLVIHHDDGLLVVDVKAVDYLQETHATQVRRYVKELAVEDAGRAVHGMLINFPLGGSRRKLDADGDGLQVVTINGTFGGPDMPGEDDLAEALLNAARDAAT